MKDSKDQRAKSKEPSSKRRKAARPKKTHKLSPGAVRQAQRAWLMGCPQAQIAQRLGVTRQAIAALVAHWREEWRADALRCRDEVLAALRMLRYEAWRRHGQAMRVPQSHEQIFEELRRVGAKGQPLKRVLGTIRRWDQAGWLRLVAWTIEHEARLLGVYRQPEGAGLELRVAGRAPEDVERSLVERIQRLLGHGASDHP